MPRAATKKPADAPLKAWPADSVERWPIAKIKPYARNARLHSEDQVQQIAASMKKFGVTTPLLVDEDGVLIFGHGRRRAAEVLGYKELPVSIARGWSEDDKKAYRIADNQLGLTSEWDLPLLQIELKELKASEFELPVLGFPELKLVAFMTNDPSSGGVTSEPLLEGLKFAVIVECLDETDQKRRLEQLDAMGLKCRALIS
jgi:ParB-like nuclease domain